MKAPRPLTDRDRDAARGFTLIEAVVVVVILAVIVLAVGASLTSSLSSTRRSSEMNHAARFLEETISSLDAQDYDALLAMNGNQIYDQPLAKDARYRIDLSVTVDAIDLLRVSGQLVDARTGRELTRVITYRSRR